MNWWIAPVVAAASTTATAALLNWQARPGMRERMLELRTGKRVHETPIIVGVKPSVTLATPFIKWGQMIAGKVKQSLHDLDLRAARAGLHVPSGYLAVFAGLVSVTGAIIGWQITKAPMSILATAGGAAAGPMSLFWLLSQTAKRRRNNIQLDLPDLADLMAVAAEAGSGLDGCIRRVSVRFKGPIREELGRFLEEVRLGTPRVDALRRLADRWDSDEGNAFIGALIQAMERGAGLSQTLKIQAKSMRMMAHQAARERAMKLPVKMLLPMALFMLPALLLIILGPAALQFMDSSHV